MLGPSSTHIQYGNALVAVTSVYSTGASPLTIIAAPGAGLKLLIIALTLSSSVSQAVTFLSGATTVGLINAAGTGYTQWFPNLYGHVLCGTNEAFSCTFGAGTCAVRVTYAAVPA